MSDVDVVAAQQAQSTASKRATLDLLRSKRRAEKELSYVINDEPATFLLRSISAVEYDRLLGEHPPKSEQRAQGASYDIHSFAPDLFSRVIVEPQISVDDWAALWRSGEWNRGELLTLFGECVDICNDGLRLGPTEPA